jgi:hypothetical protein
MDWEYNDLTAAVFSCAKQSLDADIGKVIVIVIVIVLVKVLVLVL